MTCQPLAALRSDCAMDHAARRLSALAAQLAPSGAESQARSGCAFSACVLGSGRSRHAWRASAGAAVEEPDEHAGAAPRESLRRRCAQLAMPTLTRRRRRAC